MVDSAVRERSHLLNLNNNRGDERREADLLHCVQEEEEMRMEQRLGRLRRHLLHQEGGGRKDIEHLLYS